mmetsp:Transcript_108284/g.149655  ORF Transcript_108284/g.149655 Transcript_108284/m.149655 type:complete len:143 (+) Transcript_108284:376-804(+)
MKDFQKEVNLDLVDDYDFLRNCYNEVLRIEPPRYVSLMDCFNQDVQVNNVTIKKDQPFFINIKAIHRDPQQWIDPLDFNPDRFDSRHPSFKRPDGKLRNPLAFTPFLGGKRNCLGQSIVYNTAKLVIPIVYTAFDFEFVEPN